MADPSDVDISRVMLTSTLTDESVAWAHTAMYPADSFAEYTDSCRPTTTAGKKNKFSLPYIALHTPSTQASHTCKVCTVLR